MSDYTKGLYKQLEELIIRFESLQRVLEEERQEHKEEIRSLKKHFKAQMDSLRQQHEDETNTLKASLEEANRKNELLKNEIERLKRKDNNNSSNSSNPPSGDSPETKRANTYNSRPKSSKKKGGQPGHKGTTLKKEDIEAKIADGSIYHEICDIGEKSGPYISKYVLDTKVITYVRELRFHADENGNYNIPAEYRSDVIYGDTIKSIAVDLYCEGVMANDRIAEFLRSISDGLINVSDGSVYNFIRDFSEKTGPTIEYIGNDLMNSDVDYTDSTGVTIDGKTKYIRNLSNKKVVLYNAMDTKTYEEMKTLKPLSDYSGIFVHDHETTLYHFGLDHGECGAHTIRYLRKNSEETKNTWSNDMIAFLTGINNAKNVAIAEGKDSFTEEQMERYNTRYDEILAKGVEQKKKTRGKKAYEEETRLINRLKKYKHNHLLFAKDFRVDFSNNLSERDLRKVKNRNKMAGGFRDKSGQIMYCKILSVIETCKRQKLNILDSINKIYRGQPVFS